MQRNPQRNPQRIPPAHHEDRHPASLRVQPELREAAESVLSEGETLTSLMETAMRETIHKRRTQDEFNTRAMRAREHMQRTGISFLAKDVHDELQHRLDARRQQLPGK
jgi:excinuclease UvrABC helicase subunit UvrB